MTGPVDRLTDLAVRDTAVVGLFGECHFGYGALNDLLGDRAFKAFISSHARCSLPNKMLKRFELS